MTAKERRIALAKDVIKQIHANAIKVEVGDYVSGSGLKGLGVAQGISRRTNVR